MAIGKPDYPPLLATGFHDMTLKSSREVCVDRFPLSQRRPILMDGFERLVSLLITKRVPGQFWVNGSFLTEVLEPDDVDIVLALKLDEWEACDDEQKAFIDGLGAADLKPQFHCHANSWILFPEGHALYWEGIWSLAYWIKQWGFSRGETRRKGVAVVSLRMVVT
jgi:hypothetical protein